jgi:type IV secretory pathway TrbD component
MTNRPEDRSSERIVHASLVRPELTLGVERHVAGIEGTICFALLCSRGIGLATLGFVALVILAIHPVMVWLTTKDDQATQVYARSRRYADFYAPHGLPKTSVRAPRPSIPKVR